MSDNLKRAAAERALSDIAPGMRVGLGTGSTAWHFVDLLGARVRGGFDCVGVPTSEATAAQAEAAGIPLTHLEEVDRLDVTVDGADEIGPSLTLIKGGGGALLREKIVAAASDRMIVIADQSKLVQTLGKFPLPIEVNRFGLGSTRREVAEILADFDAEGGLVLRIRGDAPVVTDGGHVILDASFGRISDPEALSRALLEVPGVVQHGLFIKLCSRAYVATPEGVRTIEP